MPADAPSGGSRGLRRLASPSSPDSPDLDVASTTPVPPPAPVLPEPDAALPPAAGRRFSASAEPSEVMSAAPRRSAVSATSPDSAAEPVFPPPPRRPTAPPPVTVTAATAYPRSVPTAPTAPADAPAIVPPQPAVSVSAATAASGATAPAGGAEVADAAASIDPPRRKRFGRGEKEAARRSVPTPTPTAASVTPMASTPGSDPRPGAAGDTSLTPRKRSMKPALIIIAAVAAVALIVTASVWALTLRSTAPSGVPSGTPVSALDPRLTANDLAGLGGIAWVDSTAATDAVRPLCLPAESDGLPPVQRSVASQITSDTPENVVVNVVDTYADEAAATAAYALRLAEAGTCPDTAAWITGANTVKNLADNADVVRLTVQDTRDLYHTLLVTRTGRTVSMFDATTISKQISAADLAGVAAKPLNRVCQDSGTCPGVLEVAGSLPSAATMPGWLVEADLPRITRGAGRWGATDPVNKLAVVGSQCEAMDLDQVTGAQSAGQRTILLVDDPDAPRGFGVDQTVYTFAAAADATKLAKKITSNLTGCANRVPTASVSQGPAVKASGVDGAKIAGSTFLVTQKTETETVLFRVAVLTVDQRVVYLLANPTSSFDFTDDQWRRIGVRAGQRTSQSA